MTEKSQLLHIASSLSMLMEDRNGEYLELRMRNDGRCEIRIERGKVVARYVLATVEGHEHVWEVIGGVE